MVKLNRYQRVVLAAAALVVGLGTASLIAADGFYGVMWIGGVLVTVALLVVAMSGIDGPLLTRPKPAKNLGNVLSAEESPATLVNNGTTYEKAWVIIATNRFEGIRKEYSVMSKLFGKANVDWRIQNRSLRRDASKAVEHFVLSTKNGRREIFFDVSSFIDKNFSVADAIGPAENDPALNRVVTIRFLPKAAFDLSGFIQQAGSSEKLREFLSDSDISNIKRGFDARQKPRGKDEIIIQLPQITAIKLGVFLDLIRKDTSDLEVQDWIDNCTGAIRYALRAG